MKGRGGVRHGLVRIIRIQCSFIFLYLGYRCWMDLNSVGIALEYFLESIVERPNIHCGLTKV